MGTAKRVILALACVGGCLAIVAFAPGVPVSLRHWTLTTAELQHQCVDRDDRRACSYACARGLAGEGGCLTADLWSVPVPSDFSVSNGFITIDANGNGSIEGDGPLRVSRAAVRQLVWKVEQTGFLALRDQYEGKTPCCDFVVESEISVILNGLHKKVVVIGSGSEPAGYLEMQRTIWHAAGEVPGTLGPEKHGAMGGQRRPPSGCNCSPRDPLCSCLP